MQVLILVGRCKASGRKRRRKGDGDGDAIVVCGGLTRKKQESRRRRLLWRNFPLPVPEFQIE